MRLVTNWRSVIVYGWNIRLIALAALLTGAETIVPDLPSYISLTDRQYAVVNFMIVASAFVARLVAQKKVSENGED